MQAFSESKWKKDAVDCMNSIKNRLNQRGANSERLQTELDNIASAIEDAASEISDLGSRDYAELLNLYFRKFPLFPSYPRNFDNDINNYKILVAKALRLSAISQNSNQAAEVLLQEWGIDKVRPNNYQVLAGAKQDYVNKFKEIAAQKPSTYTAELFLYLANNL